MAAVALDEARQQAITSFQEVCAVDQAKADEFLTHCDYNLEQAVHLFYQTGGVLDNTNEGFENQQNERNQEQELRRRNWGAASAAARESDSSASSSTASLASAHSTAAAATGARAANAGGGAVAEVSWFNWLVAVAALPFNFTFSLLYDMVELFISFFGGPRALPPVTDARGDVVRFVQRYMETYAPAVEAPITFLEESFTEAGNRARRDIRALLVILHDGSAQSSTFLQRTLSTNVVLRQITRFDLLVFGVGTTTPEGRRVAQQVRARTYPFAALMVPRNGKLVLAVQLANTASSPEAVAANLELGYGFAETELARQRTQKRRREEDARIRAEQESEYQAGLAADRAKKEEKRRKEEEQRNKEEAAKRAEEERKECGRLLMEKREQLKLLKAGEAPTVEGEAVRVQIRYPSGAKIERRFSVDDTVESLFNAIITQPACPELFSLFTNFPRKPITAMPAWYHAWRVRAHGADTVADVSQPPTHPLPTFRSQGMLQQLVVMVQDDLS